MENLEYILNMRQKLKKEQIPSINEDLKTHHFEPLLNVNAEVLKLKGYRLKPQKTRYPKELSNPYLHKDWYARQVKKHKAAAIFKEFKLYR